MKRTYLILPITTLLFFGCSHINKDINTLVPIFRTKGTFSSSFAYLGVGHLSKTSESLQTDDNQSFEIEYYPGTICYTTNRAKSDGVGHFTQSSFGHKVILVSSNYKYDIEGILLQKTVKRLIEQERISADSSLKLLSNFLWSKIPLSQDKNKNTVFANSQSVDIYNSQSIDIDKDEFQNYLISIYDQWKNEKKDFLIVLRMSPIDAKDTKLIVFE